MHERKCPQCGSTVIGHPNKKFCRAKCKDQYHNRHNPRGKFAHLAADDLQLDPHKHLDPHYYEDEFHPFDPYSLGQE